MNTEDKEFPDPQLEVVVSEDSEFLEEDQEAKVDTINQIKDEPQDEAKQDQEEGTDVEGTSSLVVDINCNEDSTKAKTSSTNDDGGLLSKSRSDGSSPKNFFTPIVTPLANVAEYIIPKIEPIKWYDFIFLSIIVAIP